MKLPRAQAQSNSIQSNPIQSNPIQLNPITLRMPSLRTRQQPGECHVGRLEGQASAARWRGTVCVPPRDPLIARSSPSSHGGPPSNMPADPPSSPDSVLCSFEMILRDSNDYLALPQASFLAVEAAYG
eukprot:scaffold379_cov235-Pinguiococcus_pyrenoidosus.AAC.9